MLRPHWSPCRRQEVQITQEHCHFSNQCRWRGMSSCLPSRKCMLKRSSIRRATISLLTNNQCYTDIFTSCTSRITCMRAFISCLNRSVTPTLASRAGSSSSAGFLRGGDLITWFSLTVCCWLQQTVRIFANTTLGSAHIVWQSR